VHIALPEVGAPNFGLDSRREMAGAPGHGADALHASGPVHIALKTGAREPDFTVNTDSSCSATPVPRAGSAGLTPVVPASYTDLPSRIIAMDAKEFIHKTVTEHPVVLFMKGTAQFPQCGFSGRAIQVLKQAGAQNLVTVNVLEDEDVRQGVKEYANWPTIPQLYVKGQFVGGSDIIMEMFQSGELQTLLKDAQAA